MKFTGHELLRFWEASGLSQRRLAKLSMMPFNSMHGKLFRAQENLKTRSGALKKQHYDPVLLKAAVFDIETMDFVTGGMRQHMICGSILALDADRPHSIT